MGLKILKRLTPCIMADFSCGDFFVVPCYCAQKQHHKVHEARVNRINCAYNTSPTYATIGFFGPATKETNTYLYISMRKSNEYIHTRTSVSCVFASNWSSWNILVYFNPEDRKDISSKHVTTLCMKNKNRSLYREAKERFQKNAYCFCFLGASF